MNAKTAKMALDIQEGACNPRAMARALVESLDIDCQNGWQIGNGGSPASRLILHQLIYILSHTDAYDEGFARTPITYFLDTDACRKMIGGDQS